MEQKPERSGTRITVLYVDDEQVLLELARVFLEKTGEFKVDTILSAEEALKSSPIATYDAIIADYQMPGMDGIQFLKTIRQQFGDIPFILFTGKGREEIVIEAINNGADFYLQKGGDPKTQFIELAHQIRMAVARKRSALSLIESEKRLRLFIQQAPVALAMFDRDMRYLAASHRWMADYHLGEMDITGRSHYEIFPELPEGLRAVHRRSLAGEVVSGKAEKFIRLDGTVQWLSWEVRPWYTAGSRIGGIIIYSEDVTERMATEEALRESERRYRDLFEVSRAVMLIIDPETARIVDANAAACRFYGYTPDEIRKLRITEINTMAPGEIREAMSRASLSEGAVFQFRHRKKNGEIRDVEVFSAPFVAGNKTLLHSIIQDISERKQAEEALRKANEKLNLLSGITRHDIKNQLLVLSGYLQVSRNFLWDPDRIADYLDKEEAVARTIGHQIDFTRDYEDLGIKAPVWQNVHAMVREAVARLPMRTITVEAENTGLEIFADPLVEKVFYNLFDNALKYGGERMTAIRVSDEETGGRMIIRVEDDGAGIQKEDKQKLFTKGFGKHTGLGLYLSREILSITGITIAEVGEPGKGARFAINVPEGAWRRV